MIDLTLKYFSITNYTQSRMTRYIFYKASISIPVRYLQTNILTFVKNIYLLLPGCEACVVAVWESEKVDGRV